MPEATMTNAPVTTAPAPLPTAAVQGETNANKLGDGIQASIPTKDKTKTGAQESKTEGQKNQEVKEAIEKFKLLIDGVEEEVDKTELIKRAQKATASDKKFQEAAKIRRQSEDLIHLLKTDPLRVLSHPALGHDVRKLAENFLYERIQEDAMTPEQREGFEAKKKVKEYEDMIQQQKRDEDAQRMNSLRSKYENEYSNDIIATLKTSGLPQTPSTVRRMAYYMHQALLKGYELKAGDVVNFVKQDYENEIKELFGALDSQTLLELLGEDTAKKIRMADLTKLKRPGQPISAEEQAPTPKGSPNKKKGMTLEEWRERNRKIVEGEE